MKTFRVQIPALSENIRIVESFIENTKDVYQINDDVYGNIMIAVTEAVNNAIKHGNREDKSKNVMLSTTYTEKNLYFWIEDEGKGFDFKNLIDPTAPQNIEKPDGRGIFLMKHLCDEVNFTKNGSKVELVFYL